MTHHKSLYYNSEWKDGNGALFQSVNPATQAVLWEGNEATESDIDQAVNSAQKAHKEWSSLLLKDKITLLNAFRDSLVKHQNKLTECICQETGKPKWDAESEVSAMIAKIDISIQAYQERCPTKEIPTGATTVWTRHKPHGVMAVLGPYNFPGHLPNGHIIPALLAGNAIVFKPSENTPLVAEAYIQLWDRLSIPKGLINLVQGGRSTGQHLLAHPKIRGILFTGSWDTGKTIAKQCAETPHKILALEMGGNNPLLIDEVNDLNAAAYLTIQSAYIGSGQRCTCARRLIIVETPQNKRFLDSLVNMIASIKLGAYTDDPEPFMGPLISNHAAEALLKEQDYLIKKGAIPLCRMERTRESLPFLKPGLIDVTSLTERQDREFFGPLLQVIRVNTFLEGLEEANRTDFGLSASILTENNAHALRFYQEVNAGIININTQTTGASSQAPFGGIGKSGNYRPSAYYAADYCSYPVASIVQTAPSLPTTLTPGICFERNHD